MKKLPWLGVGVLIGSFGAFCLTAAVIGMLGLSMAILDIAGWALFGSVGVGLLMIAFGIAYNEGKSRY